MSLSDSITATMWALLIAVPSVVAMQVCLRIAKAEDHKQRPLSEFPDLADHFQLFPGELKAIRAKGTMSNLEYRQCCKENLRQINAEIRRRKHKM